MTRSAPATIVGVAHYPVTGRYEIRVPGLALPSLVNQRLGWAAAHRQKRRQRRDLAIVLLGFGPRRPRLPATITITRRGARLLDVHDNLPAACKAIVDELARWLRIDDSDPRARWRYTQATGPVGLEVTIEELAPDTCHLPALSPRSP